MPVAVSNGRHDVEGVPNVVVSIVNKVLLRRLGRFIALGVSGGHIEAL